MAYIGGKKVGEAVRPAYFRAKTLTLALPGRYFASLDNCDGYTQVYITATDMPSAMRQFVVGDSTVTSLIISNDVTNVNGCLQSFPNLNVFVVTNTDQVVTFSSNTFNGTKIGNGNGVIVVPNSLRDAYESAYPSFNFTSWLFEIEFTIPFIGETTLTKEYVETVVKNAGGDIEIVTKVIVPVEFTEYESGSIQAIIDNFTSLGALELGINKTFSDKSQFENFLAEAKTEKLLLPNLVCNIYVYPHTTGPTIPSEIKELTIGRLDGYVNQATLFISNALKKLVIESTNFWYANGGVINCGALEYVDFGTVNIGGLYNLAVSNGGKTIFMTATSILSSWILRGSNANIGVDSLRNLINALYDYSGGEQHTLTIGATNLAKLTADDIAIATAKNWVVQ